MVLGNNVQIGPNCVLQNCRIADGAVIEAFSIVQEAIVGEHAKSDHMHAYDQVQRWLKALKV